jgi:hypothetical protein
MGVNPVFGPDASTMLQMREKDEPPILEGEFYHVFFASFLQNEVILYLISIVFIFASSLSFQWPRFFHVYLFRI